uniref:BROMI C-terminal Rab TBC-like domain-containing protein n=1 Tax=Timema douglasi TaxID=61478 RepID=A0A7R8VG25_TIMDO|nr:unnamed protein product [Timema douglasi]
MNRCLLSFILRVSSTPKGVALLLSENGLIEDVLRVQMCSPYVPWEDTQFRGAVSLLGATTEGVAVLSSESSGILKDSLNRLWAAYEDPEFMLSSNTMPTRAMQDFINVLCSLTYTFQGDRRHGSDKSVVVKIMLSCRHRVQQDRKITWNLTTTNISAGTDTDIIGVVALLSERDDESSDETLVEFVGPTKLSELLTFESCVEPWHYVGLLTLRLLTSDLNVCLYLINKLNFQDHLLKLQSENTINSEFDNFTLNSSYDEKDMIIDAHSLLRHQILVATYIVGGPSERTLPSTELCEGLDEEESVPFLFSSYPPPQSYFKQTEVSPKTQTELHRFLKETRHGPHDSGWLLHARKAYRLSCHNDIKPLVLLDLFNQVAKCFYSDVTHQVDWSNVIPDTLFPAELEGIQLTIRYGVNCGLLQARPQNFDNLSYLLKQSHGINDTPSSFEGFDWFLATAFLVSGGNLDRCYLLLNNIICLPTSKYMWSNNHSFGSDSTFGHLLECVVSAELPQCFAALQTSGVSWWLVCRRWIRQCFWNVLDWQQICHWLVLCSLESPDYIVYFCVSLLRHLQPSLLIASANQRLCDTIKVIGTMKIYIPTLYAFLSVQIISALEMFPRTLSCMSCCYDPRFG